MSNRKNSDRVSKPDWPSLSKAEKADSHFLAERAVVIGDSRADMFENKTRQNDGNFFRDFVGLDKPKARQRLGLLLRMRKISG